MEVDVIAYLIGFTTRMNTYKQEIKTETRAMIYARKKSISRAEYYKGGTSGLKPEFMLETAQINYSGEDTVELDGVKYSIYRTYNPDSDNIELYCERKGGVRRE